MSLRGGEKTMDSLMTFASGEDDAASQHGTGPNAASAAILPALPLARALYRLRRRREGMFSSRLFSDPAWDLLLDLVAAEQNGKRVSITSACIAMTASTTTALRFLKQMENEGLIYREGDPNDKRRIYIRLSGEALARMDGLFQDLQSQLAA